MTTFINTKHSSRHAGAERFDSAVENAQNAGRSLTGTRGLATLLLSAVAAAVMVVAYQVMDSVAEGHLLVLWIALWATAFIALALFSGAARTAAVRLTKSLDDWSRSLAEARADQRLWATARTDARVMNELQAAIDRAAVESKVEAESRVQPDSIARNTVYGAVVKWQLDRMNARAKRMSRYY